jgi:hypothetical protein
VVAFDQAAQVRRGDLRFLRGGGIAASRSSTV